MAIEKMLNTRIQLKYDSYSNWTSNNPALKAGEVAIAYLTTTDAVKPGEGDSQHPILFKVGPGNFNDLPWASALAADVHSWAKKSEADFITWVKSLIEVSDIDVYTKAEIDNKLNTNSNADQKAAKDYADSLAENYDAAGKAQELINALDVEDSAVTDKYVSAVSEVDGKIVVSRADLPVNTLTTGSANGTVAFNGADVAVNGLGSAAYTDSKAYDAAGSADAVNTALENYKTTNNAAVSAAAEKAQQGIDDAAAALAKANEKVTMAEVEAKDYATKAEAQGYADAKDSAIAAAKKAGDNAQSDLNSYKTSNDAAVNAKASNVDLEAEVARAKAAEKANSDAIALLVDSTEDGTKLNSIKELATWIDEHGGEAAEMAEAISDNTAAIEAEAKRADTEEKRLAGLIQTNADNISALGVTNGKVAAAIEADHAINADKAADSDKLGGTAAADYLKKADAPGYADILTKTEAASAYQPKGSYATAAQGAKADTAVQPAALENYYTKTAADAEFMNSSETNNAIDAKITALNLAATYEPIGAETRAKTYADSLAGNYATAAQGAKADSALQEITTTANGGLKVTNKNHIDIDTDVVFVFNCGSSTELVD